jgi:hypothetical protein
MLDAMSAGKVTHREQQRLYDSSALAICRAAIDEAGLCNRHATNDLQLANFLPVWYDDGR